VAKVEKTVYSRLYRSEKNKIVAGICGGIGEYFNFDPTIIRLVFVLVTIFGGGGVLIYLVLWLVVPSESYPGKNNNEHIKRGLEEIKEKARSLSHDDSRFLIGIIVLIFGVMLLLGNFGFWNYFDLGRLWPLLLVIAGFVMLSKRNERE
jgi:phage shock protein C